MVSFALTLLDADLISVEIVAEVVDVVGSDISSSEGFEVVVDMPWPNAPLVSFTMSLFEGEMRDEDVIASEILVEVVDPDVSSIKEGVEFVADMPWSNSPEGSFSMTLLDAEIKDDDLITSEIVTEVDDVGCPDVCSIEEGVKVVVVTVGGDGTTLSTEDIKFFGGKFDLGEGTRGGMVEPEPNDDAEGILL